MPSAASLWPALTEGKRKNVQKAKKTPSEEWKPSWFLDENAPAKV